MQLYLSLLIFILLDISNKTQLRSKPIQKAMYCILDYFFIIFHLALVIFNLFGWTWKKTRMANLVVLLLTGGSWFILGLFYGIGYCALTDWHWQVLTMLGNMPTETSYIQYLMARVFGLHFGIRLVDMVTLIMFLVALAVSVTMNIRDFKKR